MIQLCSNGVLTILSWPGPTTLGYCHAGGSEPEQKYIWCHLVVVKVEKLKVCADVRTAWQRNHRPSAMFQSSVDSQEFVYGYAADGFR